MCAKWLKNVILLNASAMPEQALSHYALVCQQYGENCVVGCYASEGHRHYNVRCCAPCRILKSFIPGTQRSKSMMTTQLNNVREWSAYANLLT